MNDAERLRHDPAMRWIVSGDAAHGSVASPSQTGRVETQWLAAPKNFAALSDLSFGYLLTRPVGRPAHHIRRTDASFDYQAGSWTKPRRVIAKVEWHPGELYPASASS